MAAPLCRSWCRLTSLKRGHVVTQNIMRRYATPSVKENESVIKRVKKFVFGEAVPAEQLDQSDSVYYEIKEAKTPQVYDMQPSEITDTLDRIVQETNPSGYPNPLTTDITDDIMKFKVLQRCYKEFGIVPPSYQLNSITRLQDILHYYCSLKHSSSFKTFNPLNLEDIPHNLVIGGKVPRKQV